jgi:hypothetical protein
VKSAGLRKPESIPPVEIGAAVDQFIGNHLGITRDQLFSAITKSLGLKVLTAGLRNVLEAKLNRMISEGQVTDRESKLYLICRSESTVAPSNGTPA